MVNSYNGFYIGQIVQFSGWGNPITKSTVFNGYIYKVIELDPRIHPGAIHIENTTRPSDHNYVPMVCCRAHPDHTAVEDGVVTYA